MARCIDCGAEVATIFASSGRCSSCQIIRDNDFQRQADLQHASVLAQASIQAKLMSAQESTRLSNDQRARLQGTIQELAFALADGDSKVFDKLRIVVETTASNPESQGVLEELVTKHGALCKVYRDVLNTIQKEAEEAALLALQLRVDELLRQASDAGRFSAALDLLLVTDPVFYERFVNHPLTRANEQAFSIASRHRAEFEARQHAAEEQERVDKERRQQEKAAENARKQAEALRRKQEFNAAVKRFLVGGAVVAACVALVVFVYIPHMEQQAKHREEQAKFVLAQVAEGQRSLAEKDWPSAVNRFSAALAVDARLMEAWRGLGLAHQEVGHVSEALAAATKASEIAPTNALAWQSLGHVNFMQERWREAQAAYEKAAGLESHSAVGNFCKGQAFRCAGRLLEAVAELQKAHQLSPQDPQVALALGQVFLQQTNLTSAAEWFRKALTLDSWLMPAVVGSGDVHRLRKEWEQAADAYLRVTRVKPADPTSWLRLAEAQRMIGQNREALDSSKTVVKLSPGNPAAWVELAQNYRQTENVSEATVALKKAVELAPMNFPVWLALGYAGVDQGDFTAAKAAFEKARAAQQADLGATECGLAYLELKQGKATEAVRIYREVAAREPDRLDAWTGLGEAHIANSQWGEARTALEVAVKLDPKSPRLLAMFNRAKFEVILSRAAGEAAAGQWKAARASLLEIQGLKAGDSRSELLLKQVERDTLVATALLQANDAVAAKDWLRADGFVDEALRLKPDDRVASALKQSLLPSVAEARFAAQLGQLEGELKKAQFAEAIESGRRALELKPGDPQAKQLVEMARAGEARRLRFEDSLARAALFQRQTKWDDALKAVGEALQTSPGDTRALAVRDGIFDAESDWMARLRREKVELPKKVDNLVEFMRVEGIDFRHDRIAEWIAKNHIGKSVWHQCPLRKATFFLDKNGVRLEGRLAGLGESYSWVVDAVVQPNALEKLRLYSLDKGSRIGAVVASLSERPELRKQSRDVLSGVVVERILENTPAAKSELLPADIITSIDAVAVRAWEDFTDLIRTKVAGTEVTLVVRRGTNTLNVVVRPEPPPSNAEDDFYVVVGQIKGANSKSGTRPGSSRLFKEDVIVLENATLMRQQDLR